MRFLQHACMLAAMLLPIAPAPADTAAPALMAVAPIGVTEYRMEQLQL
jgi:hypothetical protein